MLDLVDFVFAFPFTEITGITITHITEERWNMVSENKHENKSLAHLDHASIPAHCSIHIYSK